MLGFGDSQIVKKALSLFFPQTCMTFTHCTLLLENLYDLFFGFLPNASLSCAMQGSKGSKEIGGWFLKPQPKSHYALFLQTLLKVEIVLLYTVW